MHQTAFLRDTTSQLRTTVSVTLLLVGVLMQPARAATLTGVVSLDDGKPAAQALVTVYADGRFLAVETDSNGGFNVGLDGARATIRVYMDGYEPYIRTIDISDSESTLRIRLSRGPGRIRSTCRSDCYVSGVVVDNRGKPLPDTVVLAKERTLDSTTLKTTSDKDGGFRFDGVTGRPYTLLALKEEFFLEEPVVVTPSSNVVRVEMTAVRDAQTAVVRALDGVVASESREIGDRSVVVLATPLRRSLRWHTRTLETPRFESSVLTSSGTKLVLQRQRDNRTNLLAVDLTTPVNSIVFGEAPRSISLQVTVGAGETKNAPVQLPPGGLAATGLNQHDLAELLAIDTKDGVRLINDAGQFVEKHACIERLKTITSLATSSRGTVLCGNATETLLVPRGGGTVARLDRVLDSSSILVGDGGDPRSPVLAEFVEVSVTTAGVIRLGNAISGTQLHTLRVTGADEIPMEYMRRLGVLAALALQSHSSPFLVTPGALVSTDGASGLGGAGSVWNARRTNVDERLYAPVLEFERNEPVFPASVDVWKTTLLRPRPTLRGGLTQPSAGGETDARHAFFLQHYDSIRRQDPPPLGTIAGPPGSAPAARCAIHYKVVDLGSTWLIQYWFYYPFDVGGYGSHLHDSEHLFVEVAKLGGAVMNVIGAAHGGLAANNVFRAASSPLPVSLPLFAIVELGKHAMAPDVNRDGRFTPGLDDNIHHATPQLWGIRDAMGHTDSRLGQFAAHMAADHTQRLTTQDARSIFPASILADVQCACELLPLPEEEVEPAVKEQCTEGPPWNRKVAAPGSDCAAQFLLQEPDRLKVNRMWKKWNFPTEFIRGGWNTASSSSRGGLGIEFVLGLERPTKDIIHGRLSAGLSARSSVTQVTLQYEQHLTNVFGWFAGAEFIRGQSGEGSRLVLGPSAEFPLPWIHRPARIALGLGLRDGTGVSMQWRLSVGLWARQRYRFAGAEQ